MRTFFIAALAAVIVAQTACNQEKGIKTEHGFRFINHTNKGGQKPQPGQTVVYHLEAFIADSLVGSTRQNFGSPRENLLPAKDKLPKRVPALYDALLLSGEGDSVTIYETIDSFLQQFIPPDLQKKAKEVRYEIVLEKIVPQAEIDQKMAAEQQKAMAEQKINEEAKQRFPGVATMVKSTAADYRAGKLKSKLSATGSGLKMLVVEQGSGAAVKQGEPVKAHYYGSLTNGNMFDNSFDKGRPLPFAVGTGQMIPGFDEGVMKLNHGGKAYLFIPSELGYGPQGSGSIPPNSELIFYIEVL